MSTPTRNEDPPSAQFTSELSLTKDGRPRSTHHGYFRYAAALLGAVVVIGLAAAALPRAGTDDASLRVESEPPGVDVRINGGFRGHTPLVLPLAPGDYTVAIGTGDRAQERRMTLWAGERSSIYYLAPSSVSAASTGATAAPPAAVSRLGALSVVTEPPGGRVSVDGIDRGQAPVVAGNLDPGEHRLVVTNRQTPYRGTVIVEPGATSTVVIVGGVAASAAGWLRVGQVPFPLQIYKEDRLVGTTGSDTIMMPVGDHQLVFSDKASGFWASRMVTIVAGETTTLTLEMPRTAVNVNAIPWAEVWIDKQRIGETPIGNHLLTVGPHQVELRHPELGTKRVTMAVSVNGTNRLSVNMREQ